MSRRVKIEEDQLVQLLKDRDRKGIEILYDNYAAALYGMIYQVVKRDDLAEDLLQEAFIKIWNNFSQYDPAKGRLFTWMINICRHLAVDKVRSKDFINAGKNQNLEKTVSSDDSLQGISFNPDLIGLRELVKGLDTEYRQIIEFMYFKGYSQTETAQHLNIPLGTVKTRSRAAIMKLRQFFTNPVIS